MQRRRVGHLYSEGAWLFVTWHLHGSLPPARYPPPGKPPAGKGSVWMDRYLDTSRQGPRFLRQPEVAGLVVETLQGGVESGYYDLRAFVVMGNHVHVLLRPLQPAGWVLQWLKGTTARGANQILGRTGQPFWQRESYDHWVREERQLQRIVAYIENNPVHAGHAREPSQYRWSSASEGGELKFAAAR